MCCVFGLDHPTKEKRSEKPRRTTDFGSNSFRGTNEAKTIIVCFGKLFDNKKYFGFTNEAKHDLKKLIDFLEFNHFDPESHEIATQLRFSSFWPEFYCDVRWQSRQAVVVGVPNKGGYPLVNVYIAMENDHFFGGKSTISTGPFWIAMQQITRGYLSVLTFNHGLSCWHPKNMLDGMPSVCFSSLFGTCLFGCAGLATVCYCWTKWNSNSWQVSPPKESALDVEFELGILVTVQTRVWTIKSGVSRCFNRCSSPKMAI